ncbi:UNVERIFIED_CONTAM: hypothetical protein K2H54_035848 [Gekko kuhli]
MMTMMMMMILDTGILEAVARDFFDSKVTLKILNQNVEEERTGKKEHVVFCLHNEERGRNEIKERTSEDSQKDKELKIKQAGVNIQKFVPRLRTTGTRLDKYFTIVHPQVTFTISSIRKFINSQFVLKARRDKLPKSWNQRPLMKLRGQMVWMEGLQCMLYLCSPKLRSLEELEEQQMHLSDIAQHDMTRDLILFNQQRLAEIELSNQLERKKEELRILSKNLDAEKKKSEALLYSMLPKHVANQLKEGHKVEAGDFSSCTILFSDVVTFTNICSVCEPIQIVKMLNSMYSKFDRLTSVHGVYKVETIGDAYMVVGGVPVPVPSHTERVANFALGMRISVREVMNPITQEPIQVMEIT